MADRRFRGRSHSRSRSRSRSPYTSTRTNSDDPELLRSRIFLGNLPTDKLTRKEAEDIFKKYGRILGISFLKGFGFIQFENEVDAREAVRMENGGLLKGNKLDVKMAVEGRRRGGDRRRDEDGGRRGGREHHDREREFSHRRDSFERRRSREPMYDDYRRGPPPAEPDPYYDRPDPYRRDAYPPPPPPAPAYPPAAPDPFPSAAVDAPPYECQIFMLSGQIRPYAEAIERRLAQFKIISDLKMLPEELNPTKAMEDLARRKIPFAITINAQNEVHRSLTLNILHGTPQEHRNMPLDDALALVGKKFEEFVREIREKAAGPKITGPKDFAPPDSNTHYLLNLIADNRFLTVDELDTVITYLVDRKRKLEEKAGVARPDEKAINDQQAHLQNKILGLLNGSGSASAQPQPPAQPQQLASPVNTSINFNNPSVQKALDSLFQSGPNLLRNISAVQAPASQQQPQAQSMQSPFNIQGIPGTSGSYGNPDAYNRY